MATNKNTFRETLVRIVAVLGLVAVLLLGAWGIIQLAFWLPSFFSNLGSGFRGTTTRETAKETLVLSLPASVKSGEAFSLNWKHNNKLANTDYAYAISYSCSGNLTMLAPLPNGQYQPVACNTPFNFTNASSSTKLTPSASDKKTATTTITIVATKLSDGAVTATATGGTSVTSGATATTPKPTTTTKPSSSYVPSGRTTNLYGYPDLSIRIVSNPGTVYNGQRIALQFVVENVGTNVTPANWSFTAALPYTPVYTYQSPGQQKLYPGDKIVYTLGYDAISIGQQYPSQPCILIYPPAPGCMGGTQSATITVDPYNQVWESSEYNNSASVTYQVY